MRDAVLDLFHISYAVAWNIVLDSMRTARWPRRHIFCAHQWFALNAGSGHDELVAPHYREVFVATAVLAASTGMHCRNNRFFAGYKWNWPGPHLFDLSRLWFSLGLPKTFPVTGTVEMVFNGALLQPVIRQRLWSPMPRLLPRHTGLSVCRLSAAFLWHGFGCGQKSGAQPAAGMTTWWSRFFQIFSNFHNCRARINGVFVQRGHETKRVVCDHILKHPVTVECYYINTL